MTWTTSVGMTEPQTTNIPYTAWVGTEIRLAKCFD